MIKRCERHAQTDGSRPCDGRSQITNEISRVSETLQYLCPNKVEDTVIKTAGNYFCCSLIISVVESFCDLRSLWTEHMCNNATHLRACLKEGVYASHLCSTADTGEQPSLQAVSSQRSTPSTHKRVVRSLYSFWPT